MKIQTLIKPLPDHALGSHTEFPEGHLVFHYDRCTGCKSCEIACATEHSQTKSVLQSMHEIPHPFTRIWVVNIKGAPIPITCRHCENAPCISVCEAEAIKKEGVHGPVIAYPSLCQGCKCCLFACPFGVMILDHAVAAPAKCDLCIDRLSEGQPPACVESCPSKVIEYVTVQDEVYNANQDTARKIGLIAGGPKLAYPNVP